MKHIIYKSSLPSGKYYIGRHSTQNIDDGYVGSGKWIRSIKDKSQISRIILEECANHKALLEAEARYLSEHINHPDNMNFNNRAVGFGSGIYNHHYDPSPETRLKMSNQVLGDKNPMFGKQHSSETKKKLADAMAARVAAGKVYKHTEESKKKMSAKRTGFRHTAEQKQVRSEQVKAAYKTGKIKPTYGMLGKTISDEHKLRISEANKAHWAKRKAAAASSRNISLNEND